MAEYNAQKPNDGRQVSQDMVDSRYFGKNGLTRASQGFDNWFMEKYDGGFERTSSRPWTGFSPDGNTYNPYQGERQTGAGIPFSQSSGMQTGGLGLGGMQNPQLEALARANAALASQYRNQSGYPVPQAPQYSLVTPDMEQRMYGDIQTAQANQYAQQQAMMGQRQNYTQNQADPRLIDPAKRKQFGY